MKLLVTFLILFCVISAAPAHDKFQLKKKKVIYGFVQSEDSLSYKIKTMNNRDTIIEKKYVLRKTPAFVKLEHNNREIYGDLVSVESDNYVIKQNQKVINIPKNEIESFAHSNWDLNKFDPYFSCGVNLGTPAVLNVLLQYNFTSLFGVRASGFPIGKMKGGQIEVLLNLYRSKNFELNFTAGPGLLRTVEFISGNTYYPKYAMNYINLGLDLNWGGFAFGTGLAFGGNSDPDYKSFSSPQLMLFIGYTHSGFQSRY